MSSGRSSFFRDNLGIKLLSLALAILLEIYFYSPDNSVSTSILANVEFGAIPPGMMIVDPPNFGRGLTAEVQVRGPKSLIDQVKTANHRFRIAVPPGVDREFTAFLDVKQLSFPTGVEALRVRPERMLVEFEREAIKELLVVADTIGELPSGYRLQGITVFPSSIVVRGPLSEIEALQAVETTSLDVSKMSAPTRKELSLKGFGPLVNASVNLVTVDVAVEPIPLERTFAQVNVEVIAHEGVAASVQPSRVSVSLEGPTQVMQHLEQEQIKLIADTRKLAPGKHEISLALKLNDGKPDGEITIVKTEPAKVAVMVEASVPSAVPTNESPATERAQKEQ